MLKGFRPVIAVLLLVGVSSTVRSATSYDGFRWFQVEVSIFTNEFPEYRDAELWSPERLQLAYPDGIRNFARFSDYLFVPQLDQRLTGVTSAVPGASGARDSSGQPDRIVGPFPLRSTGDLHLPDPARLPFLLLPPSESDFQTTNTRLERSSTNRLLFSGVWRQPVVQEAQATPLLIQGGRRFGEHHELEGSITIRFNPNEDRVVIDSNLWLTEFIASGSGTGDWRLPPVPLPGNSDAGTQPRTYGITRIVHMQQSRDMRSTEFHYLDHPAMGLVVSVFPYDLPPAVILEAEPAVPSQ